MTWAAWTYGEMKDLSDRIARLLVEDEGLVPGNRVLLRGPNNAMMFAAWLGVLKAGGIVVATMPLLRGPARSRRSSSARGSATPSSTAACRARFR